MLKIIIATITLALCVTGLSAFASLFDPLHNPATGVPLSFVESTILGSIMFHIAILAVVSAGYLLHSASVRQFG